MKYQNLNDVLNHAEQFDKDCKRGNPQLRCVKGPVNKACNEAAREELQHDWPAEMLAALQARLDEEQEWERRTIPADALRENGTTFDVALPQFLWNEVYQKTGRNPFGLIVWAYPPKFKVFGCPVPVHPVGAEMLAEADIITCSLEVMLEEEVPNV